MSELKLCPFCGGRAEIVFNPYGGLYMVSCNKCGAIVSFKGNEIKKALREAWNRRASNE